MTPTRQNATDEIRAWGLLLSCIFGKTTVRPRIDNLHGVLNPCGSALRFEAL